MQELVFIGEALDEAAIRRGLEACLLPPALVEAGEAVWRRFPCPFPEIVAEDDADEGADEAADACALQEGAA